MSSQQSWLPRPPALDISVKPDVLAWQSSEGTTAAGALSPDIQPNSPLSFVQQLPTFPASSVLRIGNYMLTERQADRPITGVVSVHTAVHIDTGETFICRVLPLERCHATLIPFSAVGSHPYISGVAEAVVGATCMYVMHNTNTSSTEDLHAYVRRKRRLAEPEAAQLFAQALEAVAHCHRNGVIVRDIKLRRFVFADQQRTWLLLDGLYDAVVFDGTDDRLTDKHGCLAYVSPEILDATFTGAASASSSIHATSSGSYSGRAADMWSLGVMLYTMLVGRYPFADPDACALFARIRRGRYPLSPEISLSPLARCLIRSLLAVNPADRLTADEALAHPWFSSVASESFSSSTLSSQSADDSVVPQAVFEMTDPFFVD